MKRIFKDTNQQRLNTQILCGKALESLLSTCTFPGEKSREDVYSDIVSIWDKHGFLSPSDTHKKLIEKNLPSGNPIANELFLIEDGLKKLDRTSHYIRKDAAQTLSALAHLYAIKNEADISIFEADAMNLGGTNYELFLRQLSATDFSDEDKQQLTKGLTPDLK